MAHERNEKVEFGETYDNLHGYDKTWCRFLFIPTKYALVNNLDTRMTRREFLPLQRDQALADLNNMVLRPVVHVRVVTAQIVENIHGQGAVPCTDFVYNEVLIRKIFEEILRHETLGHGYTVPRLQSVSSINRSCKRCHLKELRGGVPYLPPGAMVLVRRLDPDV